MVPASPSAILAVPERAIAERPEAKDPDASGGQFAGLMAQFLQTPAVSTPPKPPAGGAAKGVKEPPADPPETQAPTDPPAQSAPGVQSRQAASAKPGNQDTKADPSTPGTRDGSTPPSAPATGTPETAAPTANQAADPALSAAASAMAAAAAGAAAAPMLQGVSADATGSMPASPRPGAPGLADSTAALPLPATPTTAPMPVPAATPMPAPLPGTTVATAPQAQAIPAPPPSAGTSPQPVEAAPATQAQLGQKAVQAPGEFSLSFTPSNSPTSAAATQAPAQPSSPQGDPVSLPSPVMVQAVLAEPGPKAKEPSKPEDQPASPEPPQALPSPQGVKTGKAAEAPLLPREAAQTPLKASPAPSLPAEAEVSGSGKAATQGAAKPEMAELAAEALTAKPAPTTQASAPRAQDGSQLAALNALSRNVETTPVAAPTPVAPRAPTAPVVQVEGGLRWMLKGGAQEAQLQLHPDSLGQVTIHLKVEGGEVHARLWITEPASVQAVQEGRPHLELSLKEQGLQLGSFDLQQGHRPFQEAPSAPAFRERLTQEGTLARQEAPAASPLSILNPHHVELYA